jgi:hypothetical protein
LTLLTCFESFILVSWFPTSLCLRYRGGVLRCLLASCLLFHCTTSCGLRCVFSSCVSLHWVYVSLHLTLIFKWSGAPTCHKKYTGQTGRSFKTRFQEPFRDFKYRNNKSTFAQHLLENGHSIGSMEDIMETVYITKKSHLMNTL